MTEDDETVLPEVTDTTDTSGAAPAWMRVIQSNCENWLQILPETLPQLNRTPEKIKDPLFRFYDRETGVGSKLLNDIREDLTAVIAACKGEIKQTNHIRSLMVGYFNKGKVPNVWNRYKVPKDLTVATWIIDFAKRVEQLQKIGLLANSGEDLQNVHVWIGGLFSPEAFITATRQAVAQAHEWALEKLVLSLDVRSSGSDLPQHSNQNFFLTDVRVDGATIKKHSLQFSEEAFTILPLTVLRWDYRNDESEGDKGIRIPVYLNGTRAELIFTCHLLPPEGTTESVVYARGVALMCSSLSGIV